MKQITLASAGFANQRGQVRISDRLPLFHRKLYPGPFDFPPLISSVTFQEDQSRLREGYAATTFSLLRRAALSLLKNDRSQKLGVKNKRLNAAWDDDYLLQVLFKS